MSGHVLVLLEALPYSMDPRVRAQVAALRDADFEVTVACPTGGRPEAGQLGHEGLRVRCFKAPRPGRSGAGYVREYGLALARLARVVRTVARERPVDLVLVCTPPDLLVALTRPLARRGAAVIVDYREISPELFEVKFGRRGIAHRALLRAERYALGHADAVTTVSQSCAELAIGRGGVDPSRLFLVGNGPDPARVHRVRPAGGPDAARRRHAGRPRRRIGPVAEPVDERVDLLGGRHPGRQ